jgi:hypothetical protein
MLSNEMISERRHSLAECEKEIARDSQIAIAVRTSSAPMPDRSPRPNPLAVQRALRSGPDPEPSHLIDVDLAATWTNRSRPAGLLERPGAKPIPMKFGRTMMEISWQSIDFHHRIRGFKAVRKVLLNDLHRKFRGQFFGTLPSRRS